MRYTLGISTCPNDTFMFHAILERRIDLHGLEFETSLHDVQELNTLVSQGRLDISKVSCYAAAKMHGTYEIGPAGAAIGFGVGPLLLKRRGAPPLDRNARVLCPGTLTTAGLLYRRFFPDGARAENLIFSEIMPGLVEGRADYGVVIHEGRFTYQKLGLELVADLGSLWEAAYRLPLPLGCIVASHHVPKGEREKIHDCVRRSVEYAFANREETLPTMRRYAQELDDGVMWSHVELYVNKWSVDLGTEGRRALETFSALVRGDIP